MYLKQSATIGLLKKESEPHTTAFPTGDTTDNDPNNGYESSQSIEFIPSKGRGLTLLQPQNAITPDESGFHTVCRMY